MFLELTWWENSARLSSFSQSSRSRFLKKANANKISRSFNGKLSIFSILDLNYWFLQKHSLNSACVSVPEGLIGFLSSTLKTHREISKKRFFEKYCSCDKACKFSVLKGTRWQRYLEKTDKWQQIYKQGSSTFYTSNNVSLKHDEQKKLHFVSICSHLCKITL